jgi:O-antigen ligase
MNSFEVKYGDWIVCILAILGLGCSIVYSTQMFDGIKTAKTFYFIIVVCLILFFLSGKVLWKKKDITISLSMPDILLALYAIWASIRLLTSDTDSVHNLYFWEFSSCTLWYFCLRSFFCTSGRKNMGKLIWFFLIVLGYVQLFFCALQLSGILSSFSPIFPVSGTFDNTSEWCIYLTCLLPVVVYAGIKADDTTSMGKIVRALCLFYVFCWLVLVLTMGSRTALLSGIIGMCVFTGFQTGFFGYVKRKLNSFFRKTFIVTVLLFIVGGLVFLLAQYKKDSADGRLLIWKVAWSSIKEAPLQGQGFNAFQAKYGHEQAVYFQQHDGNEKEIMLADNMTIAMNDYVETAFNLGLIGLLLYAAFWLSLFKRIAGQVHNNVVTVTVLVIFLVCSGFYFLEKMLSVKVIALFFAAYSGSLCKTIVKVRVCPVLLKSIAAILLIFSCVAGYATVKKACYYADWGKANMLGRFGYMEEAKMKYGHIYPHMRHNGLFLYFYARNLYENEAYQQCLEYMKKAKSQMTGSNFYVLLGDACFKTGIITKTNCTFF